MAGIGIGLGLGVGGSGAGAPARRAARVAAGATGPVFALSRLLGTGSQLSLVAGGHANLSLAGTAIHAAQALGTASQTAVIREAAGQLAVEYPVTLSGEAAPAPAPAPTPAPGPALRAMAAGAAIPTGAATVRAGVTMVRHRTRHPILAASPVIQPRFPLFRTQDSAGGMEATIAWPEGTTFRASVEVTTSTGGTPAATLRRLTFGGQDSFVAPAGGTTDAVLVPDELPASAFGLTRFAKGDVVYVKQEITFPTAGTGVHPVAAGDGTGGGNPGEGCFYGGTGSVDLPGALATQGGTQEIGRIAKPLVVLGRHTGVAVMACGDSITFGKHPAAFANSDGWTAGSWPVTAAFQAGMPLTKVAISGDRAAGFTPARRGAAIALAAFHSHALLAFGTNDVAAGGTGSGMGTLIAAVADALGAANPQLTCWGARIPLRVVSSGDGYATVAGQTLNPGWEADGLRDQADAAVRALVGSRLAGVIDINPGFADAGDPRRWKANGTAGWSTPDGTHPAQARQNDAAQIAAPLIAAWAG